MASGYGDSGLTRSRAPRVQAWLAKPYGPAALLQRVREVLDAGAARTPPQTRPPFQKNLSKPSNRLVLPNEPASSRSDHARQPRGCAPALGPSLPTVGLPRYVCNKPSKSGRAKDLLFRAVPRVLSAAPASCAAIPRLRCHRSPGKTSGFTWGAVESDFYYQSAQKFRVRLPKLRRRSQRCDLLARRHIGLLLRPGSL